MRLLIKGGRVVDPKNNVDRIADILIDDGIIAEVAENISADNAETIDAKNCIVTPGLVDMHCHLREPGFEHKEDVESGTKSAISGGVTSVACMPNTNPVTDSAEVIKYILSKAEKAGNSNVFPIGSITKGLGGAELTDFEELKNAGAVAVSDDGRPVENSAIMLSAMKKAKELGMAVISHCEDIAVGKGDMNEGEVAKSLGYKGISPTSEEIMVSRDAILSSQYNLPIHIAHISTKRSVEIIRQAKKNGTPITCETCPHYFTLTEDAVKISGANAKMNPPLRRTEDVRAIIEGIKDGTIDAIATDHAPHHADEKNQEFSKAPNGIVGLETSFALGYTYLVKKGEISLSELVNKMSLAPSKILGIDRGTLSIGAKADVCIFDIETPYKVSVDEFASKSKNSPYNNFELSGKAKFVLVNGEIKLTERK